MSSRAERRLERERMRNETINKAIDVVKGAVEGIAKIPIAPLFGGYLVARGFGWLHAQHKTNVLFRSISKEGQTILKSSIDKHVLLEEEAWAGKLNEITLALAVAGAIGGGAQLISGIVGGKK